jgi:hypothetical protein
LHIVVVVWIADAKVARLARGALGWVRPMVSRRTDTLADPAAGITDDGFNVEFELSGTRMLI